MLHASFIKFLLDARIRTTVLLILLLLLAYQISILFWQIYPQPRLADAGTSVNVLQNNEAVQQQTYQEKAEIIARSHLFGQATVETVAVEIVEEAPETKLNYKLRGIYFSEEPDLASAIVELKPNFSQHFLVGDELDENITVASIGNDHILINRYGKIERLNMEKPAVSSTANTVASRSTPSNSVSATRLLQSYKKRYVSNPLALAKRFQAIPVQENGKNIGFRLKALRGESLLKKLNFNENDVFTRINGISLDKPFQALDALKSLTTASSVSVTILRNGSEETMEFSL